MKKILLLTGLLVCTFFSFAQVVDPQERATAMRLVESNKAALRLSTEELNDAIVHTTYQIPSSDIRMVYLQQGYKGIPVYNQLEVLAFRNGKVVSNAGEILSGMAVRTKNNSGIANVTAEEALKTALQDKKVQIYTQPLARKSATNERRIEFGKLDVATENITAELLWLPIRDGKEVKLVWQVFLTPKTSSDYWLVHVDANSNTVVNSVNLTISCNWDNGKHSVQEHFEKKHFTETPNTNLTLKQDQKTHKWQYAPFVVNNASYRVIKYPAESPEHPGGAPTIHTNPWTWAPGNATSLGWHYDGTTYYDITRGNNAHAYDDAANTNNPGSTSTSTTPQPDLTFTPTLDLTQSPNVTANRQFAITNLFYWNNLMHDISYVYGFTEATRNFQANNQGRGGVGADYVLAEAQDGGGTSNANFATPADGSRPRMQMYLWNLNGANPIRDGDVDNGIIAHEYTHGISNRLTGTGVGCLGSAEQMGEGWSDFYALMVTTNWATATPTDGFTIQRPIGLYALNNGPLFTLPGIRRFPYSTNMAVNPSVYATSIPLSAHDRGEIWCATLWDMTWNIINHPGVGINPDLFNPTAGGGNAIALKLVTEGLRLQPCGPGFIDGRNAILKADTLFFGAQYSCDILRAFARRGMGIGASQGSAGSITDQIVSFDDGSTFTLTQTAPSVLEGNDITYTNTVGAECSNITGYTLTDTLPANVTYVSGGTYEPATRVVRFNPVNVTAGTTQSYSFTVNVNPGSYFPTIQIIDEPVAGPAPTIPANWAATSTTANVWSVSGVQSHTAPFAFFTPNSGGVSDQVLATSTSFALGATPPALTFWHNYNTEAGFDGCVVEISTNGGGTWTDLGPNMTSNGYNGTIDATFGNPLAGRAAFTGASGGFIKTTVNLAPYANQANVRIRFRLGSDISFGAAGWFVDDILIKSVAEVNMRSSLFDASMVRIGVRDTVSQIFPAGACTDPTIDVQPVSIVRCAVGGNAVFSVTASGSGLNYQWQSSTDNGVTWGNIFGANAASYTVTAPTAATNGIMYRVVVTGLCGTPAVSTPVVLYVNSALTHTATSATPATVCAPGSSVITGTANGGTAATNAMVGASGRISLAIPDNDPTGVNTSLTLPALTFQQAANMKIRLNMTHTWVGDIRISLTSPCGTTFVFDRPGVPATGAGNGGDLNGVYLFDLAGATVIPESGGGVIPAGTYRPSNAAGAAHDWSGFTFPCSAAGQWTLTLSDNAQFDTGTLLDWAVLIGGNYTHTLTGAGTITPNAPTGTANSTASFNVTGIPTGNQNYVLTSTDVLGCSVSTTITVASTDVPAINTQPVSRVICQGTNTTFTVAATAALTPNYQWQIDLGQGAGFVNITNAAPFSGATTATLTVTGAPISLSGASIRVIVSNTCSSVTSSAVTLTVNPLPTVTVSPSGQCGPVALTAAGTANTYSWSPASGLSATTGATVTANPVLNTNYVVTGTITATGCFASATATVNATPSTPVITPSSITICLNNPTVLTTAPITGTSSNGAQVTFSTGAAANGAPYPSTISVGGLPTSGVRIASINLNGVSHTFPSDLDIMVQSPTGTNVILMSDAGGGTDIVNANLVFADGAPALPAVIVAGTYRPTNTAGPDNFPAPGPGSITNINPTLSSFTGNMNGTWNLFSVDQANLDGGQITSWSITFEINGVLWTPATGLFTNLAATTPYTAGTTASTVYANPTATTTYSAQRPNTANCNAAPAATVVVTVVTPITITTQPASQTVCQNANVTFSTVTTGNFQNYQWQVSTNGGGTYTNIANANNASLVVPNVTVAMSTYRYRVIVSNSCSSVTSNAAILTVNPIPTVTTTALGNRICVSDTLVALTGAPVGGSWSGIGVSGSNFVPTSTSIGVYTLTYSYTSPIGCTNTATVTAKVEECPERMVQLTDGAVVLFPNPNGGRFNMRINSTLYNYLGMRVYNSAGQLLSIKNFNGLVYGRVIPIDLTHLPGGVYMVKFYYDDGVRTSEQGYKVVIGK